MTATSQPSPSSSASRPFAGMLWLVLALVWVGLVRVPLILNASDHLDSDLAVDGLTLLDSLNGRWRWHYPATPFIGTPPVLLSIVQAKLWGVTPATLASGGLVAWELVVALTFLLNRRAFGPKVASWGLVPLAFASTGAVWLSGRITGGHLLALAWHAGAFAWLWALLAKGGWARALGLGFWCGFGLYLDTMFAVSWVGLAVASSVAWWGLKPRIGFVLFGLLAFLVGAGAGVAPRLIGQRVDPHDAYVGQFSPTIQGKTLAKNAGLLACDCLPRLVAGHRLPWLEAEPDPATLPTSPRVSLEPDHGFPWLALVVTIVALGFFGRSVVALLATPGGYTGSEAASRGIRWGLVVSSLAVVAGFLISPNLDNSDNYRYLVFLLVPASTVAGLWLARAASNGRSGLATAWAIALGFASLMTADLAGYYARFGWVDASFLPVRKELKDEKLDWLLAHPEVTMILGNYWDVYRLSFLSGGRVLPVPFPQYPDRFPEIGRNAPGGRSRVVIVTSSGFGPEYGARARAFGAKELGRGDNFVIVEWPEGMRP